MSVPASVVHWQFLVMALACLPFLGTVQTDGYTVRSADVSIDPWLPGHWDAVARIRWGDAPWITSFQAQRTEDALWVRFDVTDPRPWHTYTRRDDPLWEEEVVEIFIDPDGDGRNYAEIEINSANVLCDLLMERGDPGKIGHLGWDFPGIDSRVETRADSTGATAGWSATLRLPWSGFAALPETAVALPPRAGDAWRFNVFRIKRPHGPSEPERDPVLSAWSPVPAVSFHVPEVFRPMVFR